MEAQAHDLTLSARDYVIVEELLTGMLEKIDGIDTMGRANLRMVSALPFARGGNDSDCFVRATLFLPS